MVKNTTFSGFYKRTIKEKQELIESITGQALDEGLVLKPDIANQMIENYVLNYELPLGIAPHLTINHQDYLVPLVIEEPSVVAALSRAGQEFTSIETQYKDRFIVGQIVVNQIVDFEQAQATILDHYDQLLDQAKLAYPSMVERGGGPQNLWTQIYRKENQDFLTVYLSFDPCEAMGANALNTVLESLAGIVETLTGGRVLMSILSNHSSDSLVRARVTKPIKELMTNLEEGHKLAKRICQASSYADVDIYRATTHNKGIMNGIDALALATGNDWRAIEAAAHSFAGRGPGYQALTRWWIERDCLLGEIELPIPTATVGGTLNLHPLAQWSLDLLGRPSAKKLAEIMAAVGLMQNFAAIRALVTDGIQKGHMRMQARSLAIQVGAKPKEVDALVQDLSKLGKMDRAHARSLLKTMRASKP